MVDIEEIETIVNGNLSFPDIEQLDYDQVALLLDFIKEDTEDEPAFMDHVVDMVAHRTTVRDYLPDFDLRDAETFVQYFADREYIDQWKNNMEIDYRLQWATEKSPEDIALEVIKRTSDSEADNQ